MRVQSPDRELKLIGKLRDTQANDVLVCQDLQEISGTKRLLWRVKDHKVSRRLLDEFLGNEKQTDQFECFTQGTDTFFIFDYILPRQFRKFWEIEGDCFERKVYLLKKLVLECASFPYPASVLYLILRQEQIHINSTKDICFQMNLDLTELKSREESDCVHACMDLLMTYLDPEGTKQEKRVYDLLRKKRDRNMCRTFGELYQDICLLEVLSSSKSFRKSVWNEKKDNQLFRFLLSICSILLIAALITLISQAVFSEVPLTRLFWHSFEKIGTESLLQ